MKKINFNIKLIPKLLTLAFLFFVLMTIFSVYRSYQSENFGVYRIYLYSFFSLMYLILIVLDYKRKKKLINWHKDLDKIRDILIVPTITEEGNSIILNLIKPSDRLLGVMNEMKEMIDRQKSKSPKNQKKE
jgi:hypothetical protein